MGWNPDRLKAGIKPARAHEKKDPIVTHRVALAKAVLQYPSGTVTTKMADGRVLQTRWASRLVRRAPASNQRMN